MRVLAGLLALAIAFGPERALAETEYHLAFGDVIAISSSASANLFSDQAPNLRGGKAFPVRPDGKVTLPLIGEVAIGGLSVTQVSDLLKTHYRPFLGRVEFVVNVVEFRRKSLSVLGEVNRPGPVELMSATTLLESLSRAGGLTEWASSQHVTVLRKGAIAHDLDLEAVLGGVASDPVLEEGDVVRVGKVWYRPYLQQLPLVVSIMGTALSAIILITRR